jgi:hypothetical protein
MRPKSPDRVPGLPSRRAFLRGTAGVTLALPFLESLPERSAWAETSAPVFGFFLCGTGGVVASRFFPDATGPLTQAGLAAAGKATSQLAAHADNLLLVSGIRWPPGSAKTELHGDGLCAALSARVPFRSGSLPSTFATGPSADAYIASRAHPGKPSLALYAGPPSSFIGPSLSFSGSGQLQPVTNNPYDLYLELIGLATPSGGMTPESQRAAQLLLDSRKSVHDLVREELMALTQNQRLGTADRQRLQVHFDAIRDAEKRMADLAASAARQCSSTGLDVTAFEALKNYKFDVHRTDEMAGLFMSLVAMAFACNYRRAASLQWGDAYDSTVYDVPSNDRKWKFNFISHRLASDSAIGSDQGDPTAAAAHAEIDALRMTRLAAGLDQFKARGLANQSFVMWTNQYAEGPSHSFQNVPHIIWGNGGGFLKQGAYVDAQGATNNRLLNTLISAALQDTHIVVENFGGGIGRGMLDVLRA